MVSEVSLRGEGGGGGSSLICITACLLQSTELLGAGTPKIGQSVTRRLGVEEGG